MSSFKSFIFVFFVTALVLCSCDGKSGSKVSPTIDTKNAAPDTMAFDSIVVDTVVKFGNGKSNLKCEVDISLAYAKGKNSQIINQAIISNGVLDSSYLHGLDKTADMKVVVDTLVAQFMDSYVRETRELYKTDPDLLRRVDHSYSYYVHSKISEGHNGIILYRAEIYQFFAGAHGMDWTVVNNVDMNSGRVLKVKDLFVPGGEDKMKRLLVKSFKRKYPGEQDLLQFFYKEPYVPETFVLGKDGITFVFNTGDVTPYMCGPTEFTYSYAALSKIMKPRWVSSVQVK